MMKIGDFGMARIVGELDLFTTRSNKQLK